MSDSVSGFYDGLADSYHRIFRDWNDAVVTQATIFADLIATRVGRGDQSILDCSCGIGTQSIGLALAGHRVVASDISGASTRRAAREARRRGVTLPTVVADLRSLPFTEAGFDVVVCIDNALPHLLTERELRTALGELHRVLRPGGLLIATIRDYREARRTHPVSGSPQLSDDAVTFQLWDWHDDGARYDLQHVQLTSTGDADWRVSVRRTTYWAVTTEELSAPAADAGFTGIEWLTPAESGFYQPVLLATA